MNYEFMRQRSFCGGVKEKATYTLISLFIEGRWDPPLTPLIGIFLAHHFPQALGGWGKDGRICLLDSFHQLIASMCLTFHYLGEAAV
jgi:hypothetical protein